MKNMLMKKRGTLETEEGYEWYRHTLKQDRKGERRHNNE